MVDTADTLYWVSAHLFGITLEIQHICIMLKENSLVRKLNMVISEMRNSHFIFFDNI